MLFRSKEEVAPLTKVLADNHGFETNVSHLTVFGRCSDCRPVTA